MQNKYKLFLSYVLDNLSDVKTGGRFFCLTRTDKDSALLENLVGIQLCRMYPENVYYLKSAKTGIDIDFYMPEEKLAVQAAFSLNEDSFEREVESLVKLSSGASEELRCVIVTYDEKKKEMKKFE